MSRYAVLGAAALALATALILPLLAKALYLSALFSAAMMAAALLLVCWYFPLVAKVRPLHFTIRAADEMRRAVGEPQPRMTSS
jgi:hypothetical protein